MNTSELMTANAANAALGSTEDVDMLERQEEIAKPRSPCNLSESLSILSLFRELVRFQQYSFNAPMDWSRLGPGNELARRAQCVNCNVARQCPSMSLGSCFTSAAQCSAGRWHDDRSSESPTPVWRQKRGLSMN